MTLSGNLSRLAALAGVAVGGAAPADPPLPPGVVSAGFVFENRPTPQCHASTLAESRGALVVAWFGGKHEQAPDVGIWVARRVGGKWTEPVEVANGLRTDGPRLPCWNPVLFQPKDGPLMLFYKVGPDVPRWWGMLTTSDDGGATWSAPRRLPDGVLGPIKNKPIQLPDGAILCPSSTEHDGWRIHFERTTDLGKSWQTTGPLEDSRASAAIQPALLRHRDGRLQALCRTRKGPIAETWSADDGRTWSRPVSTALPNPNSGLDAVTLADGRHLLLYNHTSRGRSPLNLAISDDGRTWKSVATLETGKGEFSYPAIIQSADGLVHLTYTWKRERVKHVVVDPAKLVPGELPRDPAAR